MPVRLALAALFLFGSVAAAQSPAPWYCAPEHIRWVETALGPQKIALARQSVSAAPEALIVVVHGDSPWRDPSYQYRIATEITAIRPTAAVAAVLRPGYRDPCGHGSGGDAGDKMGDNYSREVVDALRIATKALVDELAPREVVAIGHSGGAALVALLASSHPATLDRAALVACPCDLPAWREHMFALTGVPAWRLDLPGLSPIDFAESLSAELRMEVVVGGADEVALPAFSASYAGAAEDAGADVRFWTVPDGDHDMIIRPDILAEVVRGLWDPRS